MYAYIHTYIHTYIHAYMYIYIRLLPPGPSIAVSEEEPAPSGSASVVSAAPRLVPTEASNALTPARVPRVLPFCLSVTRHLSRFQRFRTASSEREKNWRTHRITFGAVACVPSKPSRVLTQ